VLGYRDARRAHLDALRDARDLIADAWPVTPHMGPSDDPEYNPDYAAAERETWFRWDGTMREPARPVAQLVDELTR